MIDSISELDVFPMSSAQQRLWFLERFNPGTPVYVIPVAVRLRGELDLAALEKALNLVIGRHESLRTTFADVDDEPCQVIHPAAGLTLRMETLDSREGCDLDHELVQRLVDETGRELDMQHGPLFRVRVFSLAPREVLLVLCVHHIICDGWSIGILTHELSVAYAACRDGAPALLPSLSIQYADYSEWQREWLAGSGGQRQLDWWREQLHQAPDLLTLPSDRPRLPQQSFNGATLPFRCSASITDGLRRISRSQGATLSMTVTAAFMTLLARWAQQTDIVVGIPIANRTRSEIEPLIGCFVNSLPLRARLDDNPPFTVFLGRVRDMALNAYAKQDLPFEKMVEALQPKRNLSYTPIFQVMLAYQNMSSVGLALDGLETRLVPAGQTSSRYDLTLTLSETDGTLDAGFEYNSDLFDQATLGSMRDSFLCLLNAVANASETRVLDVPLVGDFGDDANQRSIPDVACACGRVPAETVTVPGRTVSDAPRCPCLPMHRLFEIQAARTPDADAVTQRDIRLSYADLNRCANRLAHRLIRAGAGPDRLIGVCLERSPALPVALLAVLKSGAAYVPLDPSYPAERLAYIAGHARMDIVLTDAASANMPWPGSLTTVWPLGASVLEDPAVSDDTASGSSAPMAMSDSGNPDLTINPDQLAYAIYTSGSTGVPKGVAIPHGALTNFLLSMQRCPGIRADDVLPAVTTIAFDIAALELWLPLIVGARVEIIPRAIVSDGRALSAVLADCGATIMQATPATWRLLLDAGWQPSRSMTRLCGGEAMPVSLARALTAYGGELWNMYGPTETTIWSAARRVAPEDLTSLDAEQPVNIGGTLDNTQLQVMDDRLNAVPLRMPGELMIGGHGLARGYLNDPVTTAQRFVPDPSGRRPGDRLYRTGDRVRRLEDGSLAFLGRMDNQVKLRGYRIELGEIEVAIAAHPGVAQAVVVLSGAGDAQQLRAYVVPADRQASIDPVMLRRHLRNGLPDYMLPSTWIVMDRLPLTPNGKVDRKALPASSAGVPPAGICRIGARTVTEQRLIAIWRDVLKIDDVGIRDDFFDIGGHSLAVMRLATAMQNAFQCDVNIPDLFRYTTVADQANYLCVPSNNESIRHSGLVHLRPDGTRPPIFFVPGAAGDAGYLLPLARAMPGDRPFYGFRAPGLDLDVPACTDIGSLADGYIDALRTIHPRGPCLLAGHSFGSRVALEMARRMDARGVAVERLIILDTIAPVFPACAMATPTRDDEWIEELMDIMQHFVSNPGYTAESQAQELIESLRATLDGQPDHPVGGDRQRLERWVAVYKTNLQMAYTPDGPAPCPISLIKADAMLPGRQPPSDILTDVLTDPAWGWTAFSPVPVTIAMTPGNHLSMFNDPHVVTLAQSMHDLIGRRPDEGSPCVHQNHTD